MSREKKVVIIGSGFGGSVAALRYAEAGYQVTVLERGGRISRDTFEADDDMMWMPNKKRYGMNDFQLRGRNIIPWLGAAVGGGSHVYAATIKRREFFHDFPGGITYEEMAPYYSMGEKMMEAVKYPQRPPYNQLESYKIFREAQERMMRDHPKIVEDHGDILLGVAFAPNEKLVGQKFTNQYGAEQRYSDPEEQKLLGGDIDVKNSLDKNYLHLAQKHGAEIKAFAEATKISIREKRGYLIDYIDPRKGKLETTTIACDHLVLAAGAIGSTELLLQCKNLYKTLPKLSDKLGSTYFSNGDYVTGMIPKRGLLFSWIGLISAIIAATLGQTEIAIVSIMLYFLGWLISDKKAMPDSGAINSDYIRFRHRDGSTQGLYLEGGRYPTPLKAFIAIVLSLTGNYHPNKYKKIGKVMNWLGTYIPVFELLERTWPIPILMMGRDDAIGSYKLDKDGKVIIDFPVSDNDEYISYLNKLGKLLSKKANAYFIPNGFAQLSKIVEIPHNMGGVSMGNDISDGVVDTYGRVFGYEDFVVMDGSIMPTSLGPNPVGTILAFAERSMKKIIK